MKKLVFSLALLSLVFTSCTSSDDDVATTPPTATGEITGDITAAKTYTKGVYTIKGTVRVKSDATLTFEAGSVITADVADGADALLVEKGGKLNISGKTASWAPAAEASSSIIAACFRLSCLLGLTGS